MTGIDRLRAIAGAWDEWGLGGALSDIAEQIEREHDAEVADSPYDAILPEDRDSLTWVRDHGGIDYVKREWRSRVPYDRYVRRRQNLLRHIAECETALGRRREIISKLGHRVSDLTRENAELRRRAMPEGYEWPRYEDGELVGFGDKLNIDGHDEVMESVTFFCSGSVSFNYGLVGSEDMAHGIIARHKRVKRPAVPAADGEPLEVGQTVWDTDAEADTPLTIVEVSSDLVRCEYTWKDGKTYRPCYPPDQLTHTKPEPPDSAERIAEDIKRMAEEWCSYPSLREASEKAASSVGEATMGVALSNLSKRCRALAERERGE